MARKPEIGNVQLYPAKPLRAKDKDGYFLKFYCPIQGKRIRRYCGTRNRRDARRILNECRQRLLSGLYAESGGAITGEQEKTRQKVRQVFTSPETSSSMSWEECYDFYRNYRKPRGRGRSLSAALSRLSMSERILDGYRKQISLPEGGPIKEYLTLDALEYLQERLLEGDEGRFESRSTTTVNSIVTAVMAFARFCHKHGWIEKVPQVTKLEVDEPMRGRPITGEEFDHMLEAVPETVGDRSSASWKQVLDVLWESGFRISDVMNFSWDDDRKVHPKWPNQKRTHPTLVIPSSQKNKKFQEIPMLPGLQTLLKKVPKSDRRGWVVNPLPIDYQIHTGQTWFKPTTSDLRSLVDDYNNSAIARACGVTETTVRNWLAKVGLKRQKEFDRHHGEIDAKRITKIRKRSERHCEWPARRAERRLSKERVSRIISQIGENANIVVQQPDEETGRRIKYASAHDIRRGCAARLINLGVSAETLKLVMRHRNFATTERFYATRSAQSAASEIQQKISPDAPSDALVGRLVGRSDPFPNSRLKSFRSLSVCSTRFR